LGAAGTVTGSKHLLAIGDRRVLVDCGLFQGLKELRLPNWAPLPVDPSSTRTSNVPVRICPRATVKRPPPRRREW